MNLRVYNLTYSIYLTFSAQPLEKIFWFKLGFLVGNHPRHLEDESGFRLFIKSNGIERKHACQRRGVTHCLHYTIIRNEQGYCPPSLCACTNTLTLCYWWFRIIRIKRPRRDHLPLWRSSTEWSSCTESGTDGETFHQGGVPHLEGRTRPIARSFSAARPTTDAFSLLGGFRELSSEKRGYPLKMFWK